MDTQSSEQYEKLLHFVKWTARQMEGVESSVTKGIEDGRGTMYIMDTMSDSMMEQAKQLLLMPFALLTDTLAPMVRKLARDLQKSVRFEIEGADIRIDKRILEALKDPLIHMLRNSIDHGMEDPDTRIRHGKKQEGRISLRICIREDSRVEVVVQDDGRGIDIEAVKRKALRDGILKDDDAKTLSKTDAMALIFHSGLSTSRIITDVSGRGIGLSVVRENILALGGDVSVDTDPGGGTTFRMALPVSLSNARGVLIRSSGRMYIIPLQHVARGVMVHREDFSTLDGKTVMQYAERTVTVNKLEDLLDMPLASKPETRTDATVLILQLGSGFLALEIDEILWEQDVVIKPLPAPVSRVKTIAGATLLSTGELVPVLNVPDLFDHARSVHNLVRAERSTAEGTILSKLLVVDDSITSRVLLHDILISSGYSVKTAVDGIDALTCLREDEYQLVVSDVEMPRMNGFELTETIRKDEKMHDMPVILVTGLESKEDRERGFDVGANAYIVKSSFDQSNLLGVVERLL
jgi:two-component system chemotaxis sensor kinase CheA